MSVQDDDAETIVSAFLLTSAWLLVEQRQYARATRESVPHPNGTGGLTMNKSPTLLVRADLSGLAEIRWGTGRRGVAPRFA